MLGFLNRLRSKTSEDFSRKIFQIQKDLTYSLKSRPDRQSVLFILGCQRSGSTMLYNMFSRDFRAKVFGEISFLNSEDREHRIRLNDFDDVCNKLVRIKQPLIVIKPLVESQNALKILDGFPNSKVIWLLRDYKDVARSNIKKWGAANGIKNLKHVLSRDQRNWRAQNVPKDVYDVVEYFVDLDIDSFSAAALFWWVRNSFYNRLNLDSDCRVLLVKYESLVSETSSQLSKIYDFAGLEKPSAMIERGVHGKSIGAGSSLSLNAEVEGLCKELYATMSK